MKRGPGVVSRIKREFTLGAFHVGRVKRVTDHVWGLSMSRC